MTLVLNLAGASNIGQLHGIRSRQQRCLLRQSGSISPVESTNRTTDDVLFEYSKGGGACAQDRDYA